MFFQYMKEKHQTMRHQYREFIFELVRLHREDSDLVLPLTDRNKLFCEKLMFDLYFYTEGGISKELFMIDGYTCSNNKISVSIARDILKAWGKILEDIEAKKADLAEIEQEQIIFLVNK